MKIIEQWLLFRFEPGGFTPLSKPFKRKELAEKATKAGITTCVFDRNGYLYHGRVKSLADGAREGGLQF